MTDWQAIIQRAAYTRFCRTGSLEAFHLKRAELTALALQVAPELSAPAVHKALDAPRDVLTFQVRIGVPSIGNGAWVAVDEWIR